MSPTREALSRWLSDRGPLGRLTPPPDWSATPFGPVPNWPAPLSTSAFLVLASSYPMWLAWGPDMATLVNGACAKALGKGAVPPGLHAREVFADAWSCLGEALERTALSAEPVTVEDIELGAPGSRNATARYSFSLSPIAASSGSVGGVLCTMVEISEGQPAESPESDATDIALEALSQAERLDGILRQATVGFAQFDLAGRFVLVNTRFCEMVGRTQEELLRLTVADVTHPDDMPAALEPLHRAVTAGEDFVIEKRYVRPNGSSLWVSNSVFALKDAAGNPEYLVAISQDVTDRRAAEERLRLSEERYRHMFNNAAVSLWEEDMSGVRAALDGLRAAGVTDFRRYFAEHPEFIGHCVQLVRVNDVNDASLRMFGAADKEQLLHSLDDVFEERSREVFGEALLAYAEGATKFEAEAPQRTLKGDRINVLVSIAMPGPDDASGVSLVSLTDITARKRAEDALQEAYTTLEHTSRVKDEFLTTLSHELRTPLNAVLGWARMLKIGAGRPDLQERALESIERNGQALLLLVEDLLDISRIVSGKLQLKSEVTDLAQVIAAAVDAIRPAADAKNLTLEVEIDQGARALVSGDPDRLQQVVWNLLSNAAKFTPAGGRNRVTLDVRDGFARTVVADTGQGISPAFLPYVFERFRQEDGTLARKHTGLGLGLSIARHLVEAHGGTITADSAGENLGATFTVLLPVTTRADRPAAPVPGSAALREALRGLRVLVVDDDADARGLVQAMIEGYGAHATLTDSAGAALEALRQEVADVLIADIGMPEQDGYALIRSVRALAESPAATIPAIALTAHAGPDDRARATQAGFTRHLAKPVDLDNLASTIAEICSAQL